MNYYKMSGITTISNTKPSRRIDPFKIDTDNDPTRIRPKVNEPDLPGPAVPEKGKPGEKKAAIGFRFY
jgi:hypothetical protein